MPSFSHQCVVPAEGRMRIVYLHQYFRTPDQAGGTRSYEMGRRFVERGHEVHVVTADDSADAVPGWSVDEVEGMTVHRLSVRYDNTMSPARRVVAFLHFAARSGFRAGRVKPDLIFATSTPLTIAVPAALARLMTRARIVFEVRDLWPDVLIALGALQRRAPRTLAHLLERFAYRISHRIVALSPGMADGVALTGYPRDRIHVVPNSADLALFDVADEVGEQWRADRPELGTSRLAMYCGSLGVANDVLWLADVAAALPASSDLAVVVVGQGTLKEELRTHARERGVLGTRLHLLEPVPKSQMPAVMSAATVSFSVLGPHPALQASSPNKLFDAMAAGRPVVVNYGGWLARLLDETGAGIVLDRDPQAAAAALTSFTSDPSALLSAGDAARSLAREKFDRDVLAGQLVEVLERSLVE